MGAPDEMVEAVAQAEWEHDGPFLRWEQLTEPLKETSRERARTVLSVPALAEVIADAQTLAALRREADGLFTAPASPDNDAAQDRLCKRIVEWVASPSRIAALYPEAGK